MTDPVVAAAKAWNDATYIYLMAAKDFDQLKKDEKAAESAFLAEQAKQAAEIARLNIEREVWFQDARMARQLLQEWVAVDGGSWHTIRYENEKAGLFRRTKAYVSAAQAQPATPAVEADAAAVAKQLATKWWGRFVGLGSSQELENDISAALASVSAHQSVELPAVDRGTIVRHWREIVHAAAHILDDQEEGQQDPALLKAVTDYIGDADVHEPLERDAEILAGCGPVAASVSAPPGWVELVAASRRVLAGLNARIDAAPRDAVPVSDGIADLHSALAAIDGVSDAD